MTRRSNNSLNQRIASASTPQEVDQLLALGRTYFAGKRTQNNWRKAARRRLEFLQGLNGGIHVAS